MSYQIGKPIRTKNLLHGRVRQPNAKKLRDVSGSIEEMIIMSIKEL